MGKKTFKIVRFVRPKKRATTKKILVCDSQERDFQRKLLNTVYDQNSCFVNNFFFLNCIASKKPSILFRNNVFSGMLNVNKLEI